MYSVDYGNKGETGNFFYVKCRNEISGKAKWMLGILLALILSGGCSLLTTTENLRNVAAAQYGEVQGTDDTEVKPAVEQEESSTVGPNGWITRNGKKYYYVDGAYVTGWKKIKNKTYYFNKKGVMQKNKMISKNKYVNGKGVLVPKSKIFSYGKKSLKNLEKKLKKELKKYSGTHSVYVKNLNTNEYLVINNKKMKPASVIKLYNMGTVYDQVEKGRLKETKSIKSYLNSMITVSSNDSYNELLERIGHGNVRTGIGTVNKFCKKYGYKSTYCGGTLSPSYYRQTWLGGSRSTVKDCGHILEDIYRGTLVSEKASKKMLNLLKAQQRKGKIPAGLPKGVKSANKTGEYQARQHDAAIVFSKKADYVIVIMTEGDGAAISHIQKLSAITYKYFN